MATLTQLQELVTSMRSGMSTLRATNNADDAFRAVIDMEDATVRVVEMLTAAMETTSNAAANIGQRTNNIEQRITETESRITNRVIVLENQGAPAASGRKPLAESRCITGLKTLGSDKSEFKNWNEKLINAMTQSLGTPWRKFMRNLNKQLDQDRKVLTAEEIRNVDGFTDITNGDRAAEDLYFVLVESRRATRR